MSDAPMNLKGVATEDLVAMLRHVSVETGSLTCLGCGHEHNCSTRGCALIREAADRLDSLRGPAITPQDEPLTLDELRGMVGCWVWVIVTYQHEGKTFQCDGWALVETPARIAYLDQEFQLTELGTRFHAYRHQVSDFRVRFAPNEP